MGCGSRVIRCAPIVNPSMRWSPARLLHEPRQSVPSPYAADHLARQVDPSTWSDLVRRGHVISSGMGLPAAPLVRDVPRSASRRFADRARCCGGTNPAMAPPGAAAIEASMSDPAAFASDLRPPRGQPPSVPRPTGRAGRTPTPHSSCWSGHSASPGHGSRGPAGGRRGAGQHPAATPSTCRTTARPGCRSGWSRPASPSSSRSAWPTAERPRTALSSRQAPRLHEAVPGLGAGLVGATCGQVFAGGPPIGAPRRRLHPSAVRMKRRQPPGRPRRRT